jgi:hypothetical protein
MGLREDAAKSSMGGSTGEIAVRFVGRPAGEEQCEEPKRHRNVARSTGSYAAKGSMCYRVYEAAARTPEVQEVWGVRRMLRKMGCQDASCEGEPPEYGSCKHAKMSCGYRLRGEDARAALVVRSR